MRNECKVYVGKSEEKDHFKNIGMDGKIILKGFLNRVGPYGMDP
jgi:hypothetical protein